MPEFQQINYVIGCQTFVWMLSWNPLFLCRLMVQTKYLNANSLKSSLTDSWIDFNNRSLPRDRTNEMPQLAPLLIIMRKWKCRTYHRNHPGSGTDQVWNLKAVGPSLEINDASLPKNTSWAYIQWLSKKTNLTCSIYRQSIKSDHNSTRRTTDHWSDLCDRHKTLFINILTYPLDPQISSEIHF